MQLATSAFFAVVTMMGPLASPTESAAAPKPTTAATTTPAPAAPPLPAAAAPPAPPAAPVADAKLDAVVDAVQKTYEGTKDFKGKFKQKFTYTMLRRTTESQGSVTFEKPGRMRWDYTPDAKGVGDDKSFIVDGKSLWIVQPKDKVAFVNACFQQDGLTASVAFLWGEGKLREQFNISWFDGQFGEKTDHHLLLLPKQANSIFARLILVVDPATSRVKQSVVVDPAGNVNQFLFSNLEFNKGVDAKKFGYTPTAGINASRMPGTCDAPVPGIK